MSETPLNAKFVQELVQCQNRLYAYILGLVLDGNQADDVLQETNLVLCAKAGEYDASKDFAPWAYQIAHFQVMAYRKRRHRDRHVFDDELVDILAQEGTHLIESIDRRHRALEVCLSKLSESHRSLILRRYAPGSSVGAIAEELGRSAGVISQTLYRIRAALLGCIRRTLAAETHP